MSPLSFIAYHGMFGITGYGVLEILMMSVMLVVVISRGFSESPGLITLPGLPSCF
jgi:hypothetical protein